MAITLSSVRSVAIVGVLSVVIIAALVIAIVVLKRRDCLSKHSHHQKAKAEAARPSHQYYMQPKPINTSQESVSDYSTGGAYDGSVSKFNTSRDVVIAAADMGSHDLGDMQLPCYHANPITGQHTQVIHPFYLL